MTKYDSKTGRVSVAITIVSWTCVFLFGSIDMSAGVRSADFSRMANLVSSRGTLRAEGDRFLAYKHDFLDLENTAPNSGEYQYAAHLYNVAGEKWDHIYAVLSLLEIYGNVSCEEDKARIAALIRQKVVSYKGLVAPSIESTDTSIGATKRPDVAAEGIQMRDDLREIDGIFASIAADLAAAP
jgi:hypothetical protein